MRINGYQKRKKRLETISIVTWKGSWTSQLVVAVVAVVSVVGRSSHSSSSIPMHYYYYYYYPFAGTFLCSTFTGSTALSTAAILIWNVPARPFVCVSVCMCEINADTSYMACVMRKSIFNTTKKKKKRNEKKPERAKSIHYIIGSKRIEAKYIHEPTDWLSVWLRGTKL